MCWSFSRGLRIPNVLIKDNVLVKYRNLKLGIHASEIETADDSNEYVGDRSEML